MQVFSNIWSLFYMQDSLKYATGYYTNPERLIIGLVDQFLWGKEDFRGRSFRLTSYPHCFTSWRQGNVLFSVSLIYVGRLCGLQTFLTESHSCTFDSGSASVVMHIQLPYVIMQPCGIDHTDGTYVLYCRINLILNYSLHFVEHEMSNCDLTRPKHTHV